MSDLPANMLHREDTAGDDTRRTLVPAATGLALRNVLRTRLRSEFRSRGLTPVFAVPPAIVTPLGAEADAGELLVDRPPPISLPRSELALRDLAMDIVTRHHEVSTMKIKRALQASRRSRRPIKEWISPLFGRSWLAYRMLNGIRASLNPAREMEPLLRCWMPAAVFANDVFDPAEGALLRCARRLGVRTVGMVRSWDNPTNKGVLPTPIDRLLVWS